MIRAFLRDAENANAELDRLEAKGYNVRGVSGYADESYAKGKYDETYTEYRTLIKLGDNSIMKFDRDLHFIFQNMGKWHMNPDIEGKGRFYYDDDAPQEIKDAIDRINEDLEHEKITGEHR